MEPNKIVTDIVFSHISFPEVMGIWILCTWIARNRGRYFFPFLLIIWIFGKTYGDGDFLSKTMHRRAPPQA